MSIGKFIKSLFEGATSKSIATSREGYGRKSPDRNWYKVEGTFPLKYSGEPKYEIVGESQRQSTIQEIVGETYDDGVYWHVVAQLCFVEDNPHDTNAVGVFIEGRHVGYIPAADASRVRSEISAANPDERPVICKSMIRGGFKKGNKRADYGVTIGLNFPIEEQPQPKVRKQTTKP